MKARLEKLIAEYGVIAAVLWFTIFGLTWAGFAFAIQAGFEVDGAASTAGVWGAAYLATQFTKPVRLAATLALTPLVGQLWKRKKAPETQADEVIKS
ncbi:MAG: hypothetical protein AAF658_06780 [Myxococcota bacterium]